jgi:hypothetical protein
MCSMPHRSGFCSVVVTVKVAAPLAPMLNGGVDIFSRAAVHELGSEIGRGEACCCRRACRRRCA